MKIQLIGSELANGQGIGNESVTGKAVVASSSEEAVKEAGFKVAFTTVNGKAKKGADPLLLPRLRMFNKQSLFSFKSRIQ